MQLSTRRYLHCPTHSLTTSKRFGTDSPKISLFDVQRINYEVVTKPLPNGIFCYATDPSMPQIRAIVIFLLQSKMRDLVSSQLVWQYCEIVSVFLCLCHRFCFQKDCAVMSLVISSTSSKFCLVCLSWLNFLGLADLSLSSLSLSLAMFNSYLRGFYVLFTLASLIIPSCLPIILKVPSSVAWFYFYDLVQRHHHLTTITTIIKPSSRQHHYHHHVTNILPASPSSSPLSQFHCNLHLHQHHLRHPHHRCHIRAFTVSISRIVSHILQHDGEWYITQLHTKPEIMSVSKASYHIDSTQAQSHHMIQTGLPHRKDACLVSWWRMDPLVYIKSLCI